jgi:hypothetical protein
MSIRCICPNGHPLTVRESLAGSAGLCPRCRALVEVPQRQASSVSEDAILDFLGTKAAAPATLAPPEEELDETVLRPDVHERATPKKTCDRCNKEIPAGTHVCPFCRTYIANLHDF